MPNRTILNKFGLFVSQVHKVLKKKELDREDLQIINEARLIAALSSNHCWMSYKFLHNGDSFDKERIREEMNSAFNEGWKEITENDIKEVVTSEIDEHAFSIILLYSLDKDSRKEYTDLLPELKEEFIDGMEPIENIQT